MSGSTIAHLRTVRRIPQNEKDCGRDGAQAPRLLLVQAQRVAGALSNALREPGAQG